MFFFFLLRLQDVEVRQIKNECYADIERWIKKNYLYARIFSFSCFQFVSWENLYETTCCESIRILVIQTHISVSFLWWVVICWWKQWAVGSTMQNFDDSKGELRFEVSFSNLLWAYIWEWSGELSLNMGFFSWVWFLFDWFISFFFYCYLFSLKKERKISQEVKSTSTVCISKFKNFLWF